MEIQASKADYKKLNKLKKKYKADIQITLNEQSNVSVIMVHVSGNSNGDKTHGASLQEWTRGKANITSFLKYGYVRLQKNCPYRVGKCICEKCSLYLVKNGTGDCVHIWNYLK